MEYIFLFFLPVIFVLVIRIWNRPFRSPLRELLGVSDFVIALMVGIAGLIMKPFAQQISISFGFNSDTDGVVLASISILFTVLTYVTMNTASEVKKVANENIVQLSTTKDELLKFRAHLQLITLLRQAEEEAEFSQEKEIEVGHLRTLYKLFGSEEECLETLNVLRLGDKRDTLKFINQTMREYITSLLRTYKHNPAIVTNAQQLLGRL